MIHRCICSRYSLKAPPPPPKKDKKRTKRPQPSHHSRQGRKGLMAGQLRTLSSQVVGAEQMKPSNFMCLQIKFSKHLCLYQGREGKRIQKCWQFCRMHPEPVLDGHGFSPGREGSVTTLSSSRPWRRPRGPEPPPGAGLRSPTWSGRSRT